MPIQRITGDAEELAERATQLLEELGGREPAPVDAVLRPHTAHRGRPAPEHKPMLQAAEHTAVEARTAFTGVERLSRRLDHLVRATDEQLRGVAYDLHGASRSLEQSAGEIRQQPSRLLFSSPPPEREP